LIRQPAAFSLFTDIALTLIIAMLVLVVVWLDRRFDLPFIQFIVKTGLLVISYRSVIDPGIEQWPSIEQGIDAHVAYVAPLLILITAHVLALSERSRLKINIECGVWVLVAA